MIETIQKISYLSRASAFTTLPLTLKMEAYLAWPGITMPSPMAFRYWSRRTDAIGSSPGSGPPWKIRKFPAVKMRSAQAAANKPASSRCAAARAASVPDLSTPDDAAR
jgi:hypothetical protein